MLKLPTRGSAQNTMITSEDDPIHPTQAVRRQAAFRRVGVPHLGNEAVKLGMTKFNQNLLFLKHPLLKRLDRR
jgi:hypothetical protein